MRMPPGDPRVDPGGHQGSPNHEAAGFSQIACSMSAIGCKSVTNRKSFSMKAHQRADPSAVAGSDHPKTRASFVSQKFH